MNGQRESVPTVATPCPLDGCGGSAEVIDRFTLWSTDGEILHLKIRCPSGHWFTIPVDPAPIQRDLVSLLGLRGPLTLPNDFDLEFVERVR